MPDSKEANKGKKPRRKPRQKNPPSPVTTPAEQTQAQVTDPSKVDLCPGCIYDRDSCGTDEGDVAFVDDQDEQRVTACKGYVPASPPTPAPDSAGGLLGEEAYNCPEDCQFMVPSGGPADNPDVGGCAIEDELDRPEILAVTRFDPDPTLPMCPRYTQTPQGPPEGAGQATPSTPVGARPEEDLGSCGACGWPYHRTPFTNQHDAVRCVNPRCDQYRNIIRRIKALTMSERLAMSKARGTD